MSEQTKIQLRRDTAANWTSTNPTLAAGVVGFETDTYQIKIGDGSTAWNSRAYFLPGGGPSGSAGGDLTGTYPNPTIAAASQRNIARQAIYVPFTPSGIDDEFDDASFSGWTLVNDGGANVATNTEANDVLSIKLPGADPAQRPQAYLKSATISTNDIIEIGVRGTGATGGQVQCGLIMSDGTTYNAGSQVIFGYNCASGFFSKNSISNFNSDNGGTAYNYALGQPLGDVFLRLKYLGSNNWQGFASPDTVSWIDITGSFARTLSPTHCGFHATTWGGSTPYVFSLRYFRKTT